jgi:hypothetical protein
MRYQPYDPRYDDIDGVNKHSQKYGGGKALIVLGGYSALGWKALKDEIKPDVVLIANGVNSMIQDADYWLCAENMSRALNRAQGGESDGIKFMEMYQRTGAKWRFVSHRSIDRLQDRRNVVAIRRQGYELEEIGKWFSFRDYGMGLLSGWLLQHKEAGVEVYVGTVGAQLLHLAGILGCAEVHTIGYDLMFRGDKKHHAYDYPTYKADKFRTDKFRTEYKGIDTQWAWIETAQWLKEIEYLFDRDGLEWHDHSNGLLKIEGLRCAG